MTGIQTDSTGETIPSDSRANRSDRNSDRSDRRCDRCADRRNNSSQPSINKYRVGGRGHEPRNRLRFAGRFLRLCPRPHLLRRRPRPEQQRSRLRLERQNPRHPPAAAQSQRQGQRICGYTAHPLPRRNPVLPADAVLTRLSKAPTEPPSFTQMPDQRARSCPSTDVPRLPTAYASCRRATSQSVRAWMCC